MIVLALIVDQLQQRAERRLALQQQAAQISPRRLPTADSRATGR